MAGGLPPTVHAECVERTGNAEVIRLWATANGTAKTWTSRREHDPERRSITFRQERSQHPVGGMGGEWVVEPVSATACRVRLLHDFFAATDDPADLDWISRAVDRNSGSELAALKTRAELGGPDQLITFEDSVTVDGGAKDVYDFLNEAQRWADRLPHVARVELTEDTPGSRRWRWTPAPRTARCTPPGPYACAVRTARSSTNSTSCPR